MKDSRMQIWPGLCDASSHTCIGNIAHANNHIVFSVCLFQFVRLQRNVYARAEQVHRQMLSESNEDHSFEIVFLIAVQCNWCCDSYQWNGMEWNGTVRIVHIDLWNNSKACNKIVKLYAKRMMMCLLPSSSFCFYVVCKFQLDHSFKIGQPFASALHPPRISFIWTTFILLLFSIESIS